MNTQFYIEKLKTTVRLEFQSWVGKLFKEILGFDVKDNGGAPYKPDHEIFYKKKLIFITECKGFEDTKKNVGVRDLDQITRYSVSPKYKKSYGCLITNTSFSTDSDFLKQAKTNKILLLDILSLERLIGAKNNFLLSSQELKIIFINSINHGAFLSSLTIQEIEETKYFERNYLFDSFIVVISILETNCKKLEYVNPDQLVTLISQLAKELNFSTRRIKNIIKHHRNILKDLERRNALERKNNSIYWIPQISGKEVLADLGIFSIPYYANLLRKIEK